MALREPERFVVKPQREGGGKSNLSMMMLMQLSCYYYSR